jgi:hypothetical protein
MLACSWDDSWRSENNSPDEANLRVVWLFLTRLILCELSPIGAVYHQPEEETHMDLCYFANIYRFNTLSHFNSF